MEAYEQNFTSAPGIVEPQMYETALSVGSDNSFLNGTQTYEEPADSILQYQSSQEEVEGMQQHYEVPLRTSSHVDQARWHRQHQAIKPTTSVPLSGHEDKQDDKLPTYTSLYPGTMSEMQTYTPVNHTSSNARHSTMTEHSKPGTSTIKTTPPDNHHYFVLQRGQPEKQQKSVNDPVYFVLEKGSQKNPSPTHSAFQNGHHHDLEAKVVNADERIYYELEEDKSNGTASGPRKEPQLGTEEHAYFVLERRN